MFLMPSYRFHSIEDEYFARRIYFKALNVISSCRNKEHVMVASKFVEQAKRRMNEYGDFFFMKAEMDHRLWRKSFSLHIDDIGGLLMPADGGVQ